MSHTSAGELSTETRALNTQISELENQYAELFLECSNPELLKIIHLQLQALKRELIQMERPVKYAGSAKVVEVGG